MDHNHDRLDVPVQEVEQLSYARHSCGQLAVRSVAMEAPPAAL
jgi:hypothetical protein